MAKITTPWLPNLELA